MTDYSAVVLYVIDLCPKMRSHVVRVDLDLVRERIKHVFPPKTAVLGVYQLFEAAANLMLFFALFLFYRRFARGTTALYLVGYAVIRFLMEYLRGDPGAAVGPFSISQTISIALIATGLAFLGFSRIRRRSISGEPGNG